MVVTAIIGVLASVAIPAYQQYANRARFSEAILAVTPYKTAIELSVFRGLTTSLLDLQSGTNGIPNWQWFSVDTHFTGVFSGIIYVFWKFDGSPLSGTSYSLAAQNITPPIQWLEGGSCIQSGYC
jgi:type IV pilus assembly protein PilA